MQNEITVGLNGKTIGTFGIGWKDDPIEIERVVKVEFESGTNPETGKEMIVIKASCFVKEDKCDPVPFSPKREVPPRVVPIPPVPKIQLPSYAPPKSDGPIEPRVLGQSIVTQEPPIDSTEINTVSAEPPNAIPPSVSEVKKARAGRKKKEVQPEVPVDKEEPPTVDVTDKSNVSIPDVQTLPPVISSPKPPIQTSPPRPSIVGEVTQTRVAELGKLIKMWCNASGLKMDAITLEVLKTNAFDIVENDSDETIKAGIDEAKKLMAQK